MLQTLGWLYFNGVTAFKSLRVTTMHRLDLLEFSPLALGPTLRALLGSVLVWLRNRGEPFFKKSEPCLALVKGLKQLRHLGYGPQPQRRLVRLDDQEEAPDFLTGRG
jgi:hypothetical protein